MNWIKAILPSYRSWKDPLRLIMQDASESPYDPIPLGELKLTPWVRHKIYKPRRKPVFIEVPQYDKKLAVIIPYRERKTHLQKLVPKLHKFLETEGIEHEIFVIEQADKKPFNKGRLLNIGAKLCMDTCDYFCFHDVDMMPEIASYAYVNHPVLLAHSVSQFDQDPDKTIKVWHHHATYFGGVVMFTTEDFVKVNGFSNEYWHWGYEDDDIHLRCLLRGLTPIAYVLGRFISLPHGKSVAKITAGEEYYQRNKKYYKRVRRDMVDIDKDGLNNVEYKIITKEPYDLYTLIAVEL